MKKEIIRQLTISEKQRFLLDMYSFLNVINILSKELQNLRKLAESDDAFVDCLKVTNKIMNSLNDTSPVMITPHQMHEFKSYIEKEINRQFKKKQLAPVTTSMIEETEENIRSLFRFLNTRVRELIIHYGTSETWTPLSIRELSENIYDFLAALEKNSKGRYHIVYDKKYQNASDYLVHLNITSIDNKNITMPPVFQDCFCDLIANARKYSRSGGRINASLQEDGEKLIIEVGDNGLGIPEDQIEEVVEFGYRGDNIIHGKKAGYGLGLSKAYFMTKKMGGRMWIDSEVNKGTIITIHLSRPAGN